MGRKRKKGERPAVPVAGQKEVREIVIDGARYLQRYNTCGKSNCHCHPSYASHDDMRPGHGPYWYRVIRRGRRVVRRYIGKDLKLDGSGGTPAPAPAGRAGE